MIFNSLLSSALAATLACCLLGPARAPAAGLPESAVPIHKNNRLERRQNPPQAPASIVTMRQAVDMALAQNPSLAAQEAQNRASEEARKSARGAFGPKLGMNYSAVKQERKNEPSTTRAPEYGTYSWAWEVSQPVFQGFRLLASYQKAALQADSDKAALRNAELNMTMQTQSEFLAYIGAEENVKSERDALSRLKDQLRITRAFHEVGLRPRLDVLQAEVDVSQAESALIQTENTRDTAKARLNTLLGLQATAATRYDTALTTPGFSLTLEECLKTAYSQRPDLYIAAKAVEIARQDQRLAQSGYYPRIEAYYNVRQQGNTPDLQRMGNNGSRSSNWEVGASASWDVFQWGVTYYDDKRAGWLVTKVRQEEQSLKLDVGYEIKSRFLAVGEAAKRMVVAEKSVAQAAEAYDAALARYQEQVGTNFDVLNASSNLTTAQANLTSSRVDYLTALAQLYAAMGVFHPDLLKS